MSRSICYDIYIKNGLYLETVEAILPINIIDREQHAVKRDPTDLSLSRSHTHANLNEPIFQKS